MKDPDRERKIQEALEANAHKWDEKYSQEDWKSPGPKRNKVVAKRAKGALASKAMKNVW